MSESCPFTLLHNHLAADLAATDARIQAQLASIAPLIPQLSRHLIEAGGKRIRPLVVLATAAAVGYQGKGHIPLAAAIECIHSATLLHDDVVDNGQIRRGKPAARQVWGNPASVLVGDFLFSRAFELMVETQHLAVLDILSRTSTQIAEGEVLQLVATGNLNTTEAQYFQIITGKTAVLFAAAAEAAAVLAGANPATIDHCRQFGHHLGLSFQVGDDVLDYCPDSLSKESGNDFAERKITLPVIHCLQQGDAAIRAFWQNPGAFTTALTHLHTTGSLRYCADLAQHHAQLAGQALSALPDTPIRNHLQALATATGNRAMAGVDLVGR